LASDDPDVKTFPKEHEEVRSLAPGPDGRVAASIGFDRRLILWDTIKGEKLDAIEGGHEFEGGLSLQGLAFSPDGSMIAVQTPANNVYVHRANGPEPLRNRWRVHGQGKSYRPFDFEGRQELAFSPVGRRLVFGAWENVYVVDPYNGFTLLVLRGHEREVRIAKFSPDGRLIGSSADGDSLCLWDSRTGRLIQEFGTRPLLERYLREAKPGVRPSDESMAFYFTRARVPRVVPAGSRGEPTSDEYYYPNDDTRFDFDFMPAAGGVVFTADYRGLASIIGLIQEDGSRVRFFNRDSDFHCTSLDVSPDGRLIALGGLTGRWAEARGRIQVIRSDSAATIAELEETHGDQFPPVDLVRFDAASRELLFVTRDYNIHIWIFSK
jgi:WD40 repeat protein